MDDTNAQFFGGVALIYGAVALPSDPVYASTKRGVVAVCSADGLGAATDMSLIAPSLVGAHRAFSSSLKTSRTVNASTV